ncbi:MAG: phosphatase PAP2 family protein [bacterium]
MHGAISVISATRFWSLLSACLCAATFYSPTSAFAQTYELKNTSGWFLGGEALVGAGLAVGGRLAVGEPDDNCGWCESNSFDRGIRGVLVVESASKEIGYISHGVSLGIVPIIGLWGVIAPALEEDRSDHAIENVAMVLNAFLVTTAIAEVAKGAFDRQRPGVYYDRADQTEAGDFPSERNRSFFSADTAWAFSLAASASTIAHLRNYEHATLVTIGAGSAAVVAGVMRTMADMHWPTDVLAGAAVGTAVGIGMPLLLHGRADDGEGDVSVVPNNSGATVQWIFLF